MPSRSRFMKSVSVALLCLRELMTAYVDMLGDGVEDGLFENEEVSGETVCSRPSDQGAEIIPGDEW